MNALFEPFQPEIDPRAAEFPIRLLRVAIGRA